MRHSILNGYVEAMNIDAFRDDEGNKIDRKIITVADLTSESKKTLETLVIKFIESSPVETFRSSIRFHAIGCDLYEAIQDNNNGFIRKPMNYPNGIHKKLAEIVKNYPTYYCILNAENKIELEEN